MKGSVKIEPSAIERRVRTLAEILVPRCRALWCSVKSRRMITSLLHFSYSRALGYQPSYHFCPAGFRLSLGSEREVPEGLTSMTASSLLESKFWNRTHVSAVMDIVEPTSSGSRHSSTANAMSRSLLCLSRPSLFWFCSRCRNSASGRDKPRHLIAKEYI